MNRFFIYAKLKYIRQEIKVKLILNADDFGYTKEINRGIMHGMRNGIITSTTVLTNCEIDPSDCEELKSIQSTGIGIHFNLTLEKPLTTGTSIQDNNGYFYDRKKLDFYKLNLTDVEHEFRAQMNRFIELFHQTPDHIDSHHSIHDHPIILPITLKLMKEYNIPARRLSNVTFVSNFFGQNATIHNLKEMLIHHKNLECIEIMTHPGYSDDILRSKSSYSDYRENELNILTSHEIKTFIEQQGIELSYYGK